MVWGKGRVPEPQKVPFVHIPTGSRSPSVKTACKTPTFPRGLARVCLRPFCKRPCLPLRRVIPFYLLSLPPLSAFLPSFIHPFFLSHLFLPFLSPSLLLEMLPESLICIRRCPGHLETQANVAPLPLLSKMPSETPGCTQESWLPT